MAKKRKTASKTASRKSGKAAASQPAKSRKFTRDDHVNALVIAAAIAIVFIALYLYQNAKPKAALLDGSPAVTTIVPA